MDKMLNKAPVIGFIRYSQKITFGKKDRDVFEPEYFEYRFNIFEKVTLKSFQQQTDSNFVLLLLHSENMPSHYKERFAELERTNSFLYNIFVKDTWESFNEAIQNSIDYVSFEKDTAVTFRIDNDDAVQKDFIEKLSGFLKNNFIGYTVSMPTMYIVKRIEDQLYMMEECCYPANSIGLANVTGREQYKTVMDLGYHHLLNDDNTMILLAKSTNGGLQTINGKNAVNTIDHTKAILLNKEDLSKYLEERKIENLELDCLHIYNEEINHSKFSWKKMISLFVPPVFILLPKKIKKIFLS